MMSETSHRGGGKIYTSRTGSSPHRATIAAEIDPLLLPAPISSLPPSPGTMNFCRREILYELTWSDYYSDAATWFRSSIRHSPPALFPPYGPSVKLV